MYKFMRKLKPLALLLSFALVGVANANDWPAAGRPIQLTVPSPGGGGTGDTIARLLAEQLAINLKTSIVIDNRPGANGNIGAAAAAKFQPDGYRFLFSWAGTLAVNITLYEKIAYDPQKDFDPIALICDVPNILVLNSTLPPKTVKEFVAYTQANPGKLNFGSTGIGSSMHLAGELFMRETGTKMVHVPFNAPGVATTNLISNEIQLMFQLIPGIATQVKGGKVNALAVMSPTRSPALPDVPTTTELGFPKLQSTTWFALLAPRGTPPEIIAKMNLEVNKILKDPAFTKRLADIGATPLGGSPKDLSDHLGSEITKWGSLIKANGIKAQ
jgi:tripartite-type tricarboxylate transporter receptor subunit TctC